MTTASHMRKVAIFSEEERRKTLEQTFNDKCDNWFLHKFWRKTLSNIAKEASHGNTVTYVNVPWVPLNARWALFRQGYSSLEISYAFERWLLARVTDYGFDAHINVASLWSDHMIIGWGYA